MGGEDGFTLSFGPSAHSFSAESSVRFKNISSLHKYGEALIDKNSLPVEWTETLTNDQKDLEKWMLAIRLEKGFPNEWLKTDKQKAKSARLLSEGFLEPHPTNLANFRATARGFAMSDAMVKELS